jgi:hypothetical protein
MDSRFKGHYLLHDRGSSEDVERLATIMANKVGANDNLFKLPQPPYEFKEDASALESYRWLRQYLLPEVLGNSIMIGFGIGGLLAARLQEDFPAKNISVVAVNAPTSEGQIVLNNPVFNRIAIYSSAYSPIIGPCNWSQFTPQAYDVPWLMHGVKNTKYGLAYLLTSYMQSENISADVAEFMDSAPEVPRAKGAV